MDSGGSERDWPFVGREDILDSFAERLEDPTSEALLIVGRSGSGKTRLLRAMGARAAGGRRRVVHVMGAASAANVAFAPFLSIVPPNIGFDVSESQLFRLVLGEVNRDNGPVILVDDAQLLDAASASLANALAVAIGGRLVICARREETIPAAIDALARDGFARRIELPMLDRAQVATLVDTALGGEVERRVTHEAWRLSQGLPLYVHELVRTNIENGRLHRIDGRWQLVDAMVPSNRLRDLVAARLDGLDVDELGALHLLAVQPAVAQGIFEEAAGAAVSVALSRRGLVSTVARGRRHDVEIGHPLYAEVLAAQMSPSERREAGLRLADLIEASGARRRTDSLVIVTCRLSAEAPVEPARLIAAGRNAISMTDYDLAERLSRHHSIAGTAEGLALLARARAGQGRFDEADELFEQAVEMTVDGDERAALHLELALLAMQLRMDPTSAEHHLGQALVIAEHPMLTAMAQVARATVYYAVSGAGRASAALDEIDLSLLGPAERIQAAMLRASTAATAARVDDALRHCDEVRTLAPEVNAATWLVHERTDFSEVIALGIREPERALQLATEHFARHDPHSADASAPVLMAALNVAVVAGHLDVASQTYERWQRAVAGSSDRMTDHGGMIGGAMLCIELGDIEAAETILERRNDLPSAFSTDSMIHVALGRIEAAAGRRREAIGCLRQAIDQASAQGNHLFAGIAANHLSVIGDHETAAAALDGILASTGPGWVALQWQAAATAASRRDTAALETLAADFTRRGFRLDAVRSMAWSARYSSEPLQRLRRFLAAQQLLDETGGGRCPVLSAVRIELTERETEMILLVASGETNTAIADHLVMSRRTVENHLHRAYRKLDSNRAAVIDVLGRPLRRSAAGESVFFDGGDERQRVE
ncbi:MAG: LuxR C-terminal-related transcriptional regulator [Acidimicrobiales bacterium]